MFKAGSTVLLVGTSTIPFIGIAKSQVGTNGKVEVISPEDASSGKTKYESSSYDSVVNSRLSMTSDKQLVEFLRVLKPGGQLNLTEVVALAEEDKVDNLRTRSEVETALLLNS